MIGLTDRCRTAPRLLAITVAAACMGLCVPPVAAEESRPAAGTGERPAAGGMRVYIDPKTGRFVKTPTPDHRPLQLSPRTQEALSTSHEGLVETPSPVPGGGTLLFLKGRFQSPLIATIGPDGKVRMGHPGEASHAGDGKAHAGHETK